MPFVLSLWGQVGSERGCDSLSRQSKWSGAIRSCWSPGGETPSNFGLPRAKFLGVVQDLPALYTAADVFTLPTIYDPFSNACLEAVAAGLPVVTTSANGFSEIITPGVHGHVVDPGDVRGLAAALEFWKARDPSKTAADCMLLAKDYSIDRNVEATLQVLHEVIRP